MRQVDVPHLHRDGHGEERAGRSAHLDLAGVIGGLLAVGDAELDVDWLGEILWDARDPCGGNVEQGVLRARLC